MEKQQKGPKEIKKTLKRIFHYLSAFKVRMGFVIVFITISCLANVAGIYFIKPLINDYLVPLRGQINPDLSQLLGALVGLAVIYLCGVIATYLYGRIMMSVSLGTLNNMRKELFIKLQDLPLQYFDTHPHGEIMSSFTNDVDAIREMLSQGFPQIINSALMVVSTFIVMLILSPILTVLVVVMVIMMMFIVKYVGSRSKRYFIAQQYAISSVNAYAEEILEGQKVVKVFCHEESVKEEFKNRNLELQDASNKANLFSIILFPIMGNLAYLHYVLTAIVGAAMAINGVANMNLGTIGSFLVFARMFSQPITQISQQFNYIFMALAGAERVFAIIDQTPEIDEGYVQLVNARLNGRGALEEVTERTGLWAWKHPHQDGSITYTELKGDVQFEHVIFSYEPDKVVLHDLSLYAKPGQKIAFVGSTGAGKTTITNLINRFYEIQEGKIRYDGINIQKIKKDDLRRSLGMVLQDTHLFTGTVKENIRYGKLDATDEAVYQAAILANADTFIKGLPQGYDTVLTADGMNLSQGQRQLLAIARAAVANPPVLILDEATSSIDTRTEALIEKGMDKLMAGRTVFVIAHRLSTVRNSNAIMVLEHGEIIERGNHDSLIADKGKYYQLYTGAFELD